MPYPTREEEAEYARRIKAGDPDAAGELVERHLHFAKKIARSFWNRYPLCALEDLQQEAVLGMLIAARRFDPNRSATFITYAVHWAERNMMSLSHRSRGVHIPLGAWSRNGKPKVFVRSLHEVTKIGTLGGVEQPWKALVNALEDPGAALDVERAERKMWERSVKRLLATLDDRERCILEQRSGLATGQSVGLLEIAADMGLSKERVRQIEKSALKKLRFQFGLAGNAMSFTLTDVRRRDGPLAERRPGGIRSAEHARKIGLSNRKAWERRRAAATATLRALAR